MKYLLSLPATKTDTGNAARNENAAVQQVALHLHSDPLPALTPFQIQMYTESPAVLPSSSGDTAASVKQPLSQLHVYLPKCLQQTPQYSHLFHPQIQLERPG